jgi:hypothetical protein
MSSRTGGGRLFAPPRPGVSLLWPVGRVAGGSRLATLRGRPVGLNVARGELVSEMLSAGWLRWNSITSIGKLCRSHRCVMQMIGKRFCAVVYSCHG